jgi:hypothetical protein
MTKSRRTPSPVVAAALAGCCALPLSVQAAPSVSWVTPADGAVLRGAISGSACAVKTSRGAVRATFWANNWQINNDYGAPFNCTFDTTKLPDGSYPLRVRAYNSSGAYNEARINVTIANHGATTSSTNTAPSVSMTSPGSGQTVSGTIAYGANATDNAGVARIDFFLDGSSTRMLRDTSSPYGGSLDTTTLTDGAHTMRAVAYDAAGLSSSSQVSFNVSNTATSTGGTTSGGSTASTPISHEYLVLSPKVSTSPNQTHAAMVVSRSSFSNVRFSGGVQTVKQLRTGSTPNPWETAWVVFGYTDDLHYYYLAFKTNGWELGKVDPLYPGAQRYLADTASPSFAVGTQHTFSIQQDSNVISVTIDGKLITKFTDNERPYLSGKVGFYTEDATVAFDNVSGSIAEDFESYALQTFTADGTTLGTKWETPYLGYGYGAIQSDGTVAPSDL